MIIPIEAAPRPGNDRLRAGSRRRQKRQRLLWRELEQTSSEIRRIIRHQLYKEA